METNSTDILRDALIGTAPLLTGGFFVAYAGIVRLDLLSVWDGIASGNITAGQDSLAASFAVPDFWLWFYLTSYGQQYHVPFTVGSKSLASCVLDCG